MKGFRINRDPFIFGAFKRIYLVSSISFMPAFMSAGLNKS